MLSLKFSFAIYNSFIVSCRNVGLVCLRCTVLQKVFFWHLFSFVSQVNIFSVPRCKIDLRYPADVGEVDFKSDYLGDVIENDFSISFAKACWLH